MSRQVLSDSGTLPAGWRRQQHDAAFEDRKNRSLKRGSSPEDAHAEAQNHLDKALSRGLQPPEIYTHSHLHGHAPGSPLAGVVHKHPHSHLAGQPHPDPRLHHHTHTGQTQQRLTESFKWLMPFKHVFDGVKHLIKGDAITVGRTRNKVPYTAEELLRSARTLTEKPLLINHLETVDEVQHYLADKGDLIPQLVKAALQGLIARARTDVGQVVDSEFEDNGVEYVAQVTDPATQNALPLVKGVSIGAIPRTTGNPPQGIIFTDLSLIFEPEIPADPDATAEIMEKLREMLQPAKASLIDIMLEQHRRVDAEIAARTEAQMRRVRGGILSYEDLP